MWIYIWFALAMLEAAAILWLVARVMRLSDEREMALGKAYIWREACDQANAIRLWCQSSLREVAAQEAPGANATVKRMARIAREGLS